MGIAVSRRPSAASAAPPPWASESREGADGKPRLDAAALDFDGVFRRYAPYVARVGFRLMGRRDELQDLVQDVFLEAHNGLAQLSDPGAIKAWLARITVRKAVRRLRKQRLWHLLRVRQPSDLADLVHPAASPEQQAQVAGVYRALAGLPVKTRAAWLLKYVEGESLDAISEQLGISKSTVQRRLLAAQSALQEFVGGSKGDSRE